MKVVSIIDVTESAVRASVTSGSTASDAKAGALVQQSLKARKKALEEVKRACASVDAKHESVIFQKLDFGELAVLDTFYNADVVVVDMSVTVQQSSLFYHLGVRESMSMKNNIIIFYDSDPEATISMKLSCGTDGVFFPYQLDAEGTCTVIDASSTSRRATELCINPDTGPSIYNKLKKAFSDVVEENTVHIKERFLADLRKARDQYKGEELAKVLEGMKRRLDDPQLLSVDVVVNLLISYREIQDYNSMVQLVEDLEQIPNNKIASTVAVQNLYAFALNRRNKGGDRQKALEVISKVIDQSDNPIPDLLCLAGRIYKDFFIASEYVDTASLENAIKWYRKGFEVQPNEYAGINLATLLVISGKDFSNCSELQRIGLLLNNLIGKKGSLLTLKDYWDIATFFEISVLAQDYGKACQAAQRMFELEPPNWYLKSTLTNILLINQFRRKPQQQSGEDSNDLSLFHFWIEFFMEATKSEVTSILYPVLVLEPTKIYMPSYVQINNDEDNMSVSLWNISPRKDKQQHEWKFPISSIKGVSTYKRDCRAVFMYVMENSDDFHIFFSSETQRRLFHDQVCDMLRKHTSGYNFQADLDEMEAEIEFEYELDEKGNRLVLGRGSYGVVYAARDKRTQVRVAVKEVPEKQKQEVQPLHEEIKLHSRLSHKNIVKYLGSMSEDGFFKIFMEQVPGGSLSQLLVSKWGPLKDNEATIAFYTKQILEGLKYLHDNKIVHRDIKGDNVLVNTYSGVLKISDFGTSKRLAGINPCADTFAGTMQYMAPEVIDKGVRGYGPPADIWSLGCTVIEMATGKPPFIELGSPEAAMFKVGFYKMHPEIPECMSQDAKEFLLRCFDPDVDKRATAVELLEHPFIKETLAPKKKKKRVTDIEYLRSTSVPIGKESNGANMRLQLPKKKSDSPVPSPTSSSYGIDMTSPEADGIHSGPGSHDSVCKDGGFYLLRKDSERRATLVQILSRETDITVIVDTWLNMIHRDATISNPKLRKDHLLLLLQALRDFIQDQNDAVIKNVLDRLRMILDFDSTALMEIQLALYVFQEAVSANLKRHDIQPHWMFALDNVLRSATQAAITVLSPELGANLAGATGDEEQETSGVPSTNSGKSAEVLYRKSIGKEIRDQIDTVEEENLMLLHQLLIVQKSYGDILRKSIDEKKMQIEQLQQIMSTPAPHMLMMSSNPFIPDTPRTPPVPAINEPPNEALVAWLQEHGVDHRSIDKIAAEQYTLDDLLEIITWEDLQKLNIKGGILCRVWRAIQANRNIKVKKSKR
ncbi:hypothetical protein ACJMK2_029268 [Sinanodonta woodiana]|uniref:mitogen-activated protein kinase kinase kinase n=1 Tax=Sinanodonta woodiana TaxID=1069815 RepID=A0ABD3XD96_SINWO